MLLWFLIWVLLWWPGVCLSVCITASAVRPFNERVCGWFGVEDLTQPRHRLLLGAHGTTSVTQAVEDGNISGVQQVYSHLANFLQTHWMTGTLI